MSWTTLLMLVWFSVASAAPVAPHEAKRNYLDEISTELEKSETDLSKAKIATSNDRKAAEDLKLLIKEARGDILKMKSQEAPLREGSRSALESKVDDIRRQIQLLRGTETPR